MEYQVIAFIVVFLIRNAILSSIRRDGGRFVDKEQEGGDYDARSSSGPARETSQSIRQGMVKNQEKDAPLCGIVEPNIND